MSTDTPRTIALWRSKLDSNELFAWRSLATNLERELTAARVELRSRCSCSFDENGQTETCVTHQKLEDELAAAREEVERLKQERREYEHYVMTGRNEQHDRLLAELAAVKAELESKNKSIDKLVTELCDREIYLGQLKRAARHVFSDTILKDQSAEYYMRIMSIWRSWLQAAIDAGKREGK